MLVPHDMLLVLFYHCTASAPGLKSQEGEELVVKRHRNAHVSDSYLDVINDRLHLSSLPFRRIFYTTHAHGSSLQRSSGLKKSSAEGRKFEANWEGSAGENPCHITRITGAGERRCIGRSTGDEEQGRDADRVRVLGPPHIT